MAVQLNWPALYGTPVIQKRCSTFNSRSTLPDPSVVGSRVLYLDLRLSFPTMEPTRIKSAFAGLRETIPLDEEEENAVRYHWKHTIDSHGSDEPPDVGKMVQRKDKTREAIEVETGVGLDPETGKVGPYEEVWKSEHIPLDTPFAFLASDEDPSQSTRFMAVLGPHAMGLWQTAADESSSITHPNEPQHFHAILRLRSDTKKHRSGEGKLATYSKVFSTGYKNLEEQLGKLIEELLEREREGRQLWQQGERLILRDNRGKDSTWIVWDARRVDK